MTDKTQICECTSLSEQSVQRKGAEEACEGSCASAAESGCVRGVKSETTGASCASEDGQNCENGGVVFVCDVYESA